MTHYLIERLDAELKKNREYFKELKVHDVKLQELLEDSKKLDTAFQNVLKIQEAIGESLNLVKDAYNK